MVDTTINFDDVCLVCGSQRDQHGDKNHQFSLTSDVPVPLKPGPKPDREAPKTRDEAKEEESRLPDVARAFATLVEILAEKKINFDGVNRPLLDTKDIIRIFSGQG